MTKNASKYIENWWLIKKTLKLSKFSEKWSPSKTRHNSGENRRKWGNSQKITWKSLRQMDTKSINKLQFAEIFKKKKGKIFQTLTSVR